MKGLRKVLSFVGKGLDALCTATLVLFFLAWHAAVALFVFSLNLFADLLKYVALASSGTSDEAISYLIWEDEI